VAKTLARSVAVEARLLEGEVEDLAPAFCSEERMGDWADRGIFGAARGAEGLLARRVAFSEPRPGGLARDGKFVSTLERTGRCLRLAAEVGGFGLGDLPGTVGGFPDRLVGLLCVGVGGEDRERSDFVEVVGLVLNIGERGNLSSLNWATMALCPDICLLTASAARLNLSGVVEPSEADGSPGGESRGWGLGVSFFL
jgi:hypothetical protein